MTFNETENFEDCRIIFRNFAGRPTKVNREGGDRSFCILLNNAQAERLSSDGWNVRYLRAREEGEPEQPFLPVAIGYKIRPPKIKLKTSRKSEFLGEKDIDELDWVDIETVDIIVRGREWEPGN